MARMESELRFARKVLALQRRCERVIDRTRPPIVVRVRRIAEWAPSSIADIKPSSAGTSVGSGTAKVLNRYTSSSSLGRSATQAVSGVRHSVRSTLHSWRGDMDRGMAATFIEVQVYIGVGLLLRLAQFCLDHWPQLTA
jgi:hypothetical protein